MRPRIRERQARHKKPTSSRFVFTSFWKRLVITVFVVFFLLFIIFNLLPQKWDGTSRFSLAVLEKSGAVTLLVYEPISHNIVKTTIPEKTQMEASHQLGKWRLESIPELGRNEKLEENFLPQTIRKTFKLPIDTWAEGDAIGLGGDSFYEILGALFKVYGGNLSFRDKINLSVFAIQSKPSDRIEVDLIKSGFLKQVDLSDGEEGYIVASKLPGTLLSVFADTAVSQESPRITIIDATDSSVATEVAEIIEILGAKVFSIQNRSLADGDCTVRGNKPLSKTRIAKALSCNISNENSKDGFDIEIFLGKDFVKRF